MTGPWEKRNLPKIASALPKWVNPDHLTILGIVAAFIIAISYWLTWYSIWWLWLTNFGLFLHWFADSLDGTLARVRHIEREKYGYFVDHICDTWTMFVSCLGIGSSPLMHISVAMLVALSYFLLSTYVYIASYCLGVFRLSYGRLGPTELRILIFALNVLLFFWNPAFRAFGSIPVTIPDIGGFVVSGVFVAIFIVRSFRDAIKLDREDRFELTKS